MQGDPQRRPSRPNSFSYLGLRQPFNNPGTRPIGRVIGSLNERRNSFRCKEIRNGGPALHRAVAALPSSASRAQGGVLDPGRRPQRHGCLLGTLAWWRPRFTPAHASWLNEAELLFRAFSHRYLRRASWRSRQELIDHVVVSWPEYNRLYAHPFEWMWSNQQMRKWFAEHAPAISCKTS